MKNIEKFNKELSKIEYGWYDKFGNLYKSLKEGNFVKDYRMQDKNEVEKHKYSICWDLCELERDFFKKTKYPFVTIFAVLKKHKRKPCHTFLVFKAEDKFFWFEASWKNMKGLRKYDTFKDVLEDVRNNFGEFTKSNNYNKEEIEFFSYKQPSKRITCNRFYWHCMLFSKKISSNYKKVFTHK